MRRIKGFVMCETTRRLLSRFKVFWYENHNNMVEHDFGSETEGFFELIISEQIKKIFIQKDNYQSICIHINPQASAYIAKIKKT